jgi:hypothetical protein
MRLSAFLTAATALATVAGCAIVPTEPTVATFPGSQKSYDQFRDDHAFCRNQAYATVSAPQTATAPVSAGPEGAPAASTSPAPAPPASAPPSTGTPAAGAMADGATQGSVAGAPAVGSPTRPPAGASSWDLQWYYDANYVQCMYARGNRVPAEMLYMGSGTAYGMPPPNYPPPNYPAPGGPPAGGPGNNPPPGQKQPIVPSPMGSNW